jgi:hypothetical protein
MKERTFTRPAYTLSKKPLQDVLVATLIVPIGFPLSAPSSIKFQIHMNWFNKFRRLAVSLNTLQKLYDIFTAWHSSPWDAYVLQFIETSVD